MGLAEIAQVHVDFRGPGKYLKVADIFAPGPPGGRGPRLTFGLRDLRTSTYAKSQGTLTAGMRTNHCLEIVQTRWLKQRTRTGCRLLWGRNPETGWSIGWGGEERQRGSLVMTLVSLVRLPSLEPLLLETDAGSHLSLCSQGLLCACQQQGANKCLLNKQINRNVFAYKT